MSFARRWRDSGVPICRDDAIKVYYLNDWRKLRVHTDDPDATLLGREELTKHKIESDGRKVLWTDARSDLMAILMQRE